MIFFRSVRFAILFPPYFPAFAAKKYPVLKVETPRQKPGQEKRTEKWENPDFSFAGFRILTIPLSLCLSDYIMAAREKSIRLC